MSMLNWATKGLAVLIATVGLGVGSASAFNEEFTAWHNGSKMRVTLEEDTFVIRYVKPKRSLRRHGVRNGTVLFSGHISGNRKVEGEANVFRSGCDPEPYWVTGRYRKSRRSFTLRGDAPKRISGGCEVVDYTSSGSNARLSFTKSGGSSGGGGSDDGDHDDGSGDGAYCGWWAIYSCHKSRNAAIRDMNNVGYGGVVETSDVPNFRNGYYCVADGPTSKRNATRKMNRARGDFDSAYTKKGC
ncbi:MAG: hypothetical protein K0U34_03680 [Alphaproteobacteria bacterium]|nr:hypothetical protein [Alphaproteobacteria bacterium]